MNLTIEEVEFMETLMEAKYDSAQLSEINYALAMGVRKEYILKIFKPYLSVEEMREMKLMIQTFNAKKH